MAVAPRRRYLPPNPPSPPPTQGGGGMMFPKDLKAGGRNFATSISFQSYGAFGGALGNVPFLGGIGGMFGGGITLPIPRKINDVQTVVWEEASIVSAALGVSSSLQGLSTAGAIAGAGVGLRLNPALIMMFKQPNFKEWNLQWTLAPNSSDETNAVSNIIKMFKRNMSPGVSGPFYSYPMLAQISFSPSNFLPRLKPAAIMAVQTDFTAAGQPSFFRDGGPTVVNLTISLREVQLWTQNDTF